MAGKYTFWYNLVKVFNNLWKLYRWCKSVPVVTRLQSLKSETILKLQAKQTNREMKPICWFFTINCHSFLFVLFVKQFLMQELPVLYSQSCSCLIYVEVVNDYLTLSHAFEESIKVSVHLPSSLMFWDVVNIFIQIDLNTMATRKMNNNRK